MLITSRRIFEKITKPRDQLVPLCHFVHLQVHKSVQGRFA